MSLAPSTAFRLLGVLPTFGLFTTVQLPANVAWANRIPPSNEATEPIVMVQLLYGFFRKISVRSFMVNTPKVPTAHNVPLGVAAMPGRRSFEFLVFGLGCSL